MFHQLSNGDARSQGRNGGKGRYGHSPILLSWPETVTIIRFCFGWEKIGKWKNWIHASRRTSLEKPENSNTQGIQNTERLGRHGFLFGKGKVDASICGPKEKLEKHFWFYTYYTYTCDFQEIKNKGPIPMDKYLSKAEQLFCCREKRTVMQE